MNTKVIVSLYMAVLIVWAFTFFMNPVQNGVSKVRLIYGDGVEINSIVIKGKDGKEYIYNSGDWIYLSPNASLTIGLSPK